MNAEVELSRVSEIAVKERLVDEVIDEFEKSGFMCIDISAQEAGRHYEASHVYFCRKEFLEGGRAFPTQLNISLLIGEDGTLKEFDSHLNRLCL
ncbi:MAG: nucleoside-diphosphate kinase [Pseudomonadota bacterium]|nr:nucleoside-diphosphate kinase [Pseudomonadota bacterium]